MSLYADCSPVSRFSGAKSASNPNMRLPSIDEFDQGVEALRVHGAAPLPSIQTRGSLATYSPQADWTQMTYSPYNYDGPSIRALEGYPSSPPDGEIGHINQKYTIEEGDFIIYSWHDKKLPWQRIKEDFASMFRRTPKRTVQGLQALYYRMNQRIPLWGESGLLVFEIDEDLEPKHISLRCREHDSQDHPMEALGLAQRYPERAINYTWVDADVKGKSHDWATKRMMQYRERQKRRKVSVHEPC
ncbi:hypothetical protein NHJ6243_009399 [Beauveria neobassiana]